MSTLDTFARIARATGAKPPIDYLRGKMVQRVIMLNDGFFFHSSLALIACSLDPSYGKVIFLSFDDHECLRNLAEKLHITARNHVYISPNSTVLFSEAAVPRQITITTSETQFAASSIVASTTHGFEKDELTSLIKDLHPIANDRAPFLKMLDVDGWCDQFVFTSRCFGSLSVSVFTTFVCVGFTLLFRRAILKRTPTPELKKHKQYKRKDSKRDNNPQLKDTIVRFSFVLYQVIDFADNAWKDPTWRTMSSDGWIFIDSMLETPVMKKMSVTFEDIIYVTQDDARFDVQVKHRRLRRRICEQK